MARLIGTDRHISDAVNNADSFRLLRGRVSVLKKAPNARLMPYMELAGFGSVALIRSSDLRFDLLFALLGLPIDGCPVTGVSSFTDPVALCHQLLGDSPGDGESYFSGIKFTWLKAKIGQLSATATEGELMCAARAYIMHIVGGLLMPDANDDNVHLMYLPLLVDLSTASSYSWGSAVLAMLYRELCRATNSDVVDMGGCLILLQSWALYWLPFLASVSHQPWSVCPGIGKSYTVPIYRRMIEQHAREEFIWMPYRRSKIANVVPSSAYVDSHIWCTNAPIINFNVVEWYHGDRVLQQFGCIQPIPDPPC
ncbi:serine/threonine-protein phosphatase 7 long form homolog [Gossypium hirsutum]|uniref:Serine/threonine-protein phosphatase 7 long form homolog n=1 Tax=Gossypium hirsutum TaxID=3635 RepID=A0A1U8MVN3_GOSHI|nr:serine/threonine-protein phosphatase 7 long form homolog [Gossypium hirsutum]